MLWYNSNFQNPHDTVDLPSYTHQYGEEQGSTEKYKHNSSNLISSKLLSNPNLSMSPQSVAEQAWKETRLPRLVAFARVDPEG